MNHDRYREAIQELADGTLGSIRRTELELHLEQCESCRRFAEDVRRIRQIAGSFEPLAPPDHVWLQIAGRLRREGRVTAPAPRAVPAGAHRFMPLAIAASLMLIVGASLYMLYSGGARGDRQQVRAPNQADSNAAQADVVQSVETEFRLAEQHYQNAIAKLEEAAKSGSGAIDAQTAATLKKSLEVIDQAIAESRAALRSDPQSTAAVQSLFDALNRKVILLQETIALMNQMRKGDAAGAAQIVDSVNKS